MSSEIKTEIQLEIGHVLFMDIVDYSTRLINEQRALRDTLNEIVRSTEAFRDADAAGTLIKSPTGDGMALVFHRSPEEPVNCALEISRALKAHPELPLRMGVHSGPVTAVIDVNDTTSVAGAGINMAQRVMDCGDAGHILVSQHVAEDLEQYAHWKPQLHDLGECEVKHGVRVHLVNLYTDDLGNRALPEKLKPSRGSRKYIPYALIALASFLCGMGVLGLMLWKAEALTKLGLIGNLYYIVLFPLGLCAAVFLFGVVRSFARYKGEQYGSTLELGGPIVAFVLTFGGGLIVPPPSTFPLTVYVHGEVGRSDLVLRNSGRVFVDLDGDRQSRSIGENGEAIFPAIPNRFRGQEVPIWVDANGFESAVANQKERVDGTSLYLPVRRKSGQLSGRVQDQDGNPISGAELSVAGVLTHSDASGHFELIIPGDKLAQEMDLQAVAHGYKTRTYKVVPNANELTITLPTLP